MRRKRVSPYGLSIRPTRLLSGVFAVAVLWMLYGRLKDPATWRVLFDMKDDVPVAAEQVPVLQQAPAAEVVVPGPNDLDEAEVAAAQEMFQLVTDKSPLAPREMHAYWRLLTWSRTMPLAELQRRALQDVAYTELWEQPERFRGKPIMLRLHVRRVRKYDAPSNPQELSHMYEAWGWTDESRSYPFVVVFSECPEGLPVGTDVRAEVVVVGYFLKVMKYTAFDSARGAPLLVGRVQLAPTRAVPAQSGPDPSFVLWLVFAGSVVVGIAIWLKVRSRRVVRNLSLPDDAMLVESLSFANGDGTDQRNTNDAAPYALVDVLAEGCSDPPEPQSPPTSSGSRI